jgi:hypothetical protein
MEAGDLQNKQQLLIKFGILQASFGVVLDKQYTIDDEYEDMLFVYKTKVDKINKNQQMRTDVNMTIINKINEKYPNGTQNTNLDDFQSHMEMLR